MTRRHVHRPPIGEPQPHYPMAPRHGRASDLSKRKGDPHAGGVERPHDVADTQVFHRNVTRWGRDARPSGETDRTRRLPARGPARHGEVSSLIDRPVDAACLLWSAEDREEVKAAARLLQTQRVEHLPIAVDRELLIFCV